jgi:hypothetical protein
MVIAGKRILKVDDKILLKEIGLEEVDAKKIKEKEKRK